MGYIIYDKKVAFISSHKESFGFIVESVEFAGLQKMQFDILWNAAKGKRKSGLPKQTALKSPLVVGAR